jgi:hypothetical protein
VEGSSAVSSDFCRNGDGRCDVSSVAITVFYLAFFL